MTKPAYFIIEANIHNLEVMKPYQERVAATYEKFGGKALVLGGSIAPLEGTPPQGKIIILRFDSMEQAKAWHNSPEYQAILAYRQQGATSDAYFIEGIEE